MLQRLIMNALIAVLLLSSVRAVLAQEIVLVPFTEPAYGVQGVIPEGWIKREPGLYIHDADESYSTAIVIQSTPPIDESVWSQLGMDGAPESTGTYTSPVFEWTLYQVDFDNSVDETDVRVHVALAERGSRQYSVTMHTERNESDSLYQAVFMPVITQLDVLPVAGDIDTALIDSYIEEVMAADRIPGLALAIVHDDRIVYMQGYGTTGVNDMPITPNTAFQLGSMSKSFTALAIMQLVENSSIDLDTPVQRYLPTFQVGSPASAEAITVRHLLHHTSGIPGNAPRASGTDQSLQAQVAALASAELSHEPGTTYEYASPNYIVLGRIVEVVSGLSFAKYVERYIFQPLHMTHSYTSMAAAREEDFASGHRLWAGFPVVSSLAYEPGRLPTASLMSSASDLANYMIAHLNEGQFAGESVLSPAYMELLHTPAVAAEDDQQYAMGWRVGPINGIRAVHHGGILPDYRGKMVMLPEEGWGVVVLTNVSTIMGRPSSHDIADNLAGMLVGQPLSSSTLGIGMLYLGLTLGAGLILLAQLRNLLSIRQWQQKYANAQGQALARRKHMVELASGLLFPLLMVVGLPTLLGLSWAVLIEQAPDLSYWALVAAALEILITLLRGLMLVSFPKSQAVAS
ncbi:MAG: serine hydrolase domain-containing protein [Anaerolinea sp.]